MSELFLYTSEGDITRTGLLRTRETYRRLPGIRAQPGVNA